MTGAATDVLVLGAGPVGLALACLLRRGGMDCTVVETGRTGPSRRRIDPRALALTPAARAILAHCGAWARLDAADIGEFRRMVVEDACGGGRIEFDCADLCVTTLGHIVNQGDLEGALRAALAASGPGPVRAAVPDRIRWSPEAVAVHFADGSCRSARLLVGADGARSPVRELAGVAYAARPYEQHALACTVRTALPHGHVARQWFLADGPLAFLPLADTHVCGIVWSTTPAHARRLQLADEPVFRAELASASGYALGGIAETGSRVVFPLQCAQAERYCRARLALVGDAAHSVHPLAGQGANLGLLDAASLAELLLAARAAGRDPGALRPLRAYERWRRGENGLMITALDGLQKLFAAHAAPVRRLRSAGLTLCDALAPVKHALMKRAMGLTGDLPAAARVPLLAGPTC